MSLPTLNRRQTSVRQQRRWYLLLPLLATFTALAGLATCHPLDINPYSAFNVTKELEEVKATWMKPCGDDGQEKDYSMNDTSFHKSTKLLNMERQINLTLLDLHNWPGSNDTVTTWNDTRRKRHFKFLQPFVKNESSWERRLSVYWAYLKLVRQFNDNYPETNINRDEKDALESVNEATRQLLCMVQEYREVTKKRIKVIDAEQMKNMTKFSIKDASEIKIHIWYIMCRLECFLKNMRKHIRHLSVKGSPAPINTMSCKTCPYCGKSNKQCKPPKKKQRKQQQHQQQRKHNRTGHSAQQKQSNQRQQPSTRQPKVRKGTRTLNNHARNKQG